MEMKEILEKMSKKMEQEDKEAEKEIEEIMVLLSEIMPKIEKVFLGDDFDPRKEFVSFLGYFHKIITVFIGKYDKRPYVEKLMDLEIYRLESQKLKELRFDIMKSSVNQYEMLRRKLEKKEEDNGNS